MKAKIKIVILLIACSNVSVYSQQSSEDAFRKNFFPRIDQLGYVDIASFTGLLQFQLLR
jgi:hypothetical protein